jgi:hypothetical protein
VRINLIDNRGGSSESSATCAKTQTDRASQLSPRLHTQYCVRSEDPENPPRPVRAAVGSTHNTCARCGATGKLDAHHITYDPVRVVRLCVFCHARITGLNTRACHCWYPYKKLDNDLRLYLFNKIFMKANWEEKKRFNKKEVLAILREYGCAV